MSRRKPPRSRRRPGEYSPLNTLLVVATPFAAIAIAALLMNQETQSLIGRIYEPVQRYLGSHPDASGLLVIALIAGGLLLLGFIGSRLFDPGIYRWQRDNLAVDRALYPRLAEDELPQRRKPRSKRPAKRASAIKRG